jgi:hypothetical protein
MWLRSPWKSPTNPRDPQNTIWIPLVYCKITVLCTHTHTIHSKTENRKFADTIDSTDQSKCDHCLGLGMHTHTKHIHAQHICHICRADRQNICTICCLLCYGIQQLVPAEKQQHWIIFIAVLRLHLLYSTSQQHGSCYELRTFISTVTYIIMCHYRAV